MLKKVLTIVAVAGVAKVVLDKLTGGDDADLWAEATDPVDRSR
ncbi:MAG: DLW-39 family protein [Actinomycetota bacterium]|jgi:hypothetical protein|nr:DLW-39 family protein [Actinomycetota bacterium]MDQ3307724.1 DLW-39 family protein [Actinomycetota bacterium]